MRMCVRVINFRRVNATLQCTNARAPACVCTSVPILHVLRVQKKSMNVSKDGVSEVQVKARKYRT